MASIGHKKLSQQVCNHSCTQAYTYTSNFLQHMLLSQPFDFPPSHLFRYLITSNLSSWSTCCYQSCYQSHLTSLHLIHSIPSSLPNCFTHPPAAHIAIRAIWPPSIPLIPFPHHFQSIYLLSCSAHCYQSHLTSLHLTHSIPSSLPTCPPTARCYQSHLTSLHLTNSIPSSFLTCPAARCYQSDLTSLHLIHSIPSLPSTCFTCPPAAHAAIRAISSPSISPIPFPHHFQPVLPVLLQHVAIRAIWLPSIWSIPFPHHFQPFLLHHMLLSEPFDFPPSHPFHSLITSNLSSCTTCCYQSHLTSLHLTHSIPSSLPSCPPAAHVAIRAIWPPSISPIPFPHHFHPVLLQHMLLSEPFDLPLYHPFHSLITLNLSYLSSSSTCCYQSQLASFLLQAVGSCHRQTYTGCSEWMTNTQGPAP